MLLDELKRNRAERMHRIKQHFDDEYYAVRDHASQRQLLKRIERALYGVHREDVYKLMAECQQGQRCGSLWCNHCREQASRAAAGKVYDRVNIKMYGNDHLLHVTAPVGLARFNSEDVNRVLHEDDLRWKRIRKKNHFWIEAVYEFELVNFNNLQKSNGSDLKKVQMKQMIEASREKSNELVFVHWHGVTDLKRDQVDHVFGSEYFIDGKPLIKTSASGLYVQKLHSEKECSYNIRKICSYPFKSAYRYKHTFKGSDYSNGEYFTLDELGQLISIYHDVQGRQWRRLRRNSGRNS